MTVYLNGEFIDEDRAMVPVADRGFLFADGVYEVVRVYGGEPCFMEPHLARMSYGLSELRIPFHDVDALADVSRELIDRNDLGSSDAAIYIQATRGAPGKRKHAFPDGRIAPTVYATAHEHDRHPSSYFAEGVEAVTTSDTRWSRCDIKSIALLPNVLANQLAHEQGAFEALFVRDGVVLEGSHANLFAVYDGELVTYPSCNYILSGITRGVVLELAAELDIPAREGPIFAEQLFAADELFLSGTTTEVMPLTKVDGKPIGGGTPGAVARRLQEAYLSRARGGR